MDAGTVSTPIATPPAGPATAADRSAHLRAMWATVAPSWGEYADFTDTRHTPDSARMLEWTSPAPGEGVLELACGAGGMGLAAAALVGPTGHVTVSDVAVEMTTIASARATALAITNVKARVLDLGRIDQPDGSFDVVLCRDGLQFASDPAAAVGEIRRVLRPGGRTAVAVWGPIEANPWLSVVFNAVSTELGRPMPPAGVPGPFSLADAAQLTELFLGAGLIDVVVDEVHVPLTAPSFDQWWTTTCALAGPLAAVLTNLPPATAAAIRGRAEQAVTCYHSGGGLQFPGTALVAAGKRDA